MITISDVMRRKSRNGLFGIECEVEGANLPPTITLWETTEDGSLRANPQAYEYRLQAPLPLDGVAKALSNFKEEFDKHGSRPNLSFRCSTHIHRNVGDLSPSAIARIVTLYYLLEPMVSSFFPADRLGNRFALRLQDAPGLITRIAGSNSFQYREENMKYASLNLVTIRTLGSMEFRLMEGCVDPDRIFKWVNIINEIVQFAVEEKKSVEEILDMQVEELSTVVKSHHFYTDDLEVRGIIEYNRSMLIDMLQVEDAWVRLEKSLEVSSQKRANAGERGEGVARIWIDELTREPRPAANIRTVQQYRELAEFNDNDSEEDDG